MRRVWIEMNFIIVSTTKQGVSPSMRRVWIEIYLISVDIPTLPVTLHAEGVD